MKTATSTASKSRSGIADIVRRIWARDYSLWTDPSPGGGGDWMGWLDLPSAELGFPPLTGEMSEGQRGPEQLDQAHSNTLSNITSLNILGMGGSSLTPEVLSNLFPNTTPALNVLDTVNPATIQDALNNIDLTSAAFAVASKSGTTIEPLSLEAVFRQSLSDSGVKDASNHFIAISDPGTPLADRAKNGDFAAHIETPANVGGRFSALSAFGMFPASICEMPTNDMTASAIAMADRCRAEDESNPGIELGLFIARNALRGRDKVTFVMAPSLERFGLWLEQLIAESTGKNRRGLIPIADEPIMPIELYGHDRQFIRIALAGEETHPSAAFDIHPTYQIELPNPAAIAGEFFRWEFATSVAASAIGVYPFDQPDVESAKQLARRALESEDNQRGYSESLTQTVEAIVANANPPDYVAIAAFLPESDALTAASRKLRTAITRATGAATTFGYGPRYLHSTGQLHKGGPDSVHLIAITQEADIDVQVPGQSYSLGQLLAAQAAGDVQACLQKGRRAALVKLHGDPCDEIYAASAKIGQLTLT